MTWVLVTVLAAVTLGALALAAWTVKLAHDGQDRHAELTDRLLSAVLAKESAPVKASYARIERDRHNTGVDPVADVRAEAEQYAAMLDPDRMPVGMDGGLI